MKHRKRRGKRRRISARKVQKKRNRRINSYKMARGGIRL